jgi:CheY-like chemotaxis protein
LIRIARIKRIDPQLSCTGTATAATSPVGEIGGMDEETRGRILVVEDDPEAALFVVHVLANRCRFEVIHTADPLVALRLATDEHWDLLVTDLDMPGMTGLELLGALRQVAPGLPVAVVSAHALDGASAGLPGDADRYLEKPLRVDQLIATATALIGRGRPLSDDPRRDNLRAWPLKSREPGSSSPARVRGSGGRWLAGWPRRAPGWWSTT